MEVRMNDLLKQAMEEYEDLKGDEMYWRVVELREKNLRDQLSAKEDAIAEGLAQGRAEGRAEGQAKEKKEIAKELLKEGIDIDIIIKTTKLSREEVEKIKEQM